MSKLNWTLIVGDLRIQNKTMSDKVHAKVDYCNAES